MPEMGELIGPPVPSVQTPAPGTDPEIPLRVFDDSIDEVVAETLVITQSVLVYGERISVITVKPLPGPEPHESPAVLQRADDIAVRKPLKRPQMLE